MKIFTLCRSFSVMIGSTARAATMLDETRDALICEGHGARVMLNRQERGHLVKGSRGNLIPPLIQVGDVDVDAECRYARTGKD